MATKETIFGGKATRYTIIWIEEGGASENHCKSVTEVSESLYAYSIGRRNKWLREIEQAQPGDIVLFDCGWIVVRRK